jgi:DNA-binding CsgD family transcriptional regulator
MLAEWPLIGRGREVARLRSLLTDPRSRGAMLAGPAGVGKTRLARECLAAAAQAGMATLTVTGSQSAAAVPYGAVASVLSAFGGVGTKASQYPDPGAFVDDVMLGIIAGSRPQSVFLLVDDAHLLDRASALLILRLAARKEVFVLLTIRAREPVPDAITSLWKDGLVERLEIANLDGAAIEELLSTVLGGPVDGATLAALTARSDANLLFLRELVAAALADGTLRRDHGLWRLVGESSPPARLIEVVETRLGRLSAGEHHLLELIAIGEPVGAGVRALSRLEVAERLEELGLVSSRDDGRRLELRLAHPIYGEILRSRLSGARQQQLARSLAETIEQTGMRRREDILRVGSWRLLGGGGAPDLLLTAATTARWQYDLELADRLAQAAVSAGAGLEAELLRAQLQVLRGQPEAAEERLSQLLGTLDAPRDRARTGIALLDVAYLQAQPLNMLDILERLSSAPVDDSFRADLSARRLVASLLIDGPRRALAEPLPHYDETRDDAAFPIAVGRAQAYLRMGRTASAKRELDTLDAVTATAGRVGLWRFPGIFLASERLADDGHLAESIRVVTEHYQRGVSSSSVEVQAISAWALGHRHLLAGRLRTAARFAREAIAGCEQLGVRAGVLDATGLLALIEAIIGAARASITSDPEPSRPAAEASNTFSLGLAGQAQAWTAIASGDTRAARALFTDTAQRCLAIGDLKWGVSSLHGLVRIGHPEDALDPLETTVPEMEGPWAALCLRHARALAQPDAPALREVALEFDALGAALLAAEAAAQAGGAWELLQDSRQASAARSLAVSIAQRCEGAVTPALQSLATYDTLTEAELETARYAADGLSNKAIAQRLYLSVRTVESRLQTVYNKLGIRSRDALGAALLALPQRERGSEHAS